MITGSKIIICRLTVYGHTGNAVECQARLHGVMEGDVILLVICHVACQRCGQTIGNCIPDVIVCAVLPSGGHTNGIVGVHDLLLELGLLDLFVLVGKRNSRALGLDNLCLAFGCAVLGHQRVFEAQIFSVLFHNLIGFANRKVFHFKLAVRVKVSEGDVQGVGIFISFCSFVDALTGDGDGELLLSFFVSQASEGLLDYQRSSLVFVVVCYGYNSSTLFKLYSIGFFFTNLICSCNCIVINCGVSLFYFVFARSKICLCVFSIFEILIKNFFLIVIRSCNCKLDRVLVRVCQFIYIAGPVLGDSQSTFQFSYIVRNFYCLIVTINKRDFSIFYRVGCCG